MFEALLFLIQNVSVLSLSQKSVKKVKVCATNQGKTIILILARLSPETMGQFHQPFGAKHKWASSHS